MSTRRNFLAGLGAALSASALLPRFAFADLPTDRRLVIVLLRGGVDGLAMVPPHGDAQYQSARGNLALPGPSSTEGVADLDGFFGLHPALEGLMPHWDAGQLAAVHAVALPYRKRSHFDAQNMLENGTDRPYGAHDGWLNRAVGKLGGRGLALGKDVPLLLQGDAPVLAIDPTDRATDGAGYLDDVGALYANDPLLGRALEEGIASRAMLEQHVQMSESRGRGRRRQALGAALSATGKLMAVDDGPRVGVIHAGGWDTHAQQGRTTGSLAGKLGQLAAGLDKLAVALEPVWDQTAIVVVTEFGRTVRANGTGGTDHGTAGAALMLGGAVRGGRVHADWPGLSRGDLFEGRDLAPTTDLRALFKAALRDHLRLPEGLIEDEIFPDSRLVRPLASLFA